MKIKSRSIAIVIAPYHKKISEKMYKAAVEEAAQHSFSIASVVIVPGCFEIPLAVANVIDAHKLDGVVVLGMIERGQTLHGEVMGHSVAQALLQLELTKRIPIGKGIIGPGATQAQGLVRATPTGRGAVAAVAAMIANAAL